MTGRLNKNIIFIRSAGHCQNYISNSPLMTQYLFVLVKPIDLTLSFGKIRMT